MKISIYKNSETLSREAAKAVVEGMKTRKEPVICVASGDSPAGMYKEIVALSKNDPSLVAGWNYVGLDEWMGMNGAHEGSCQYHLNNQLFHPLKVKDEKIVFFDGTVKDPLTECERIELFIKEKGGIDVAILGLGLNGHIGMNEPGTSVHIRSHISQLDPLTQQTGQKYFTHAQELKEGLTLGIATLMEAKKIILIVNGKHKAAILKQVVEGPLTEKVPGTILQKHPNCVLYMDEAAASELTQQ